MSLDTNNRDYRVCVYPLTFPGLWDPEQSFPCIQTRSPYKPSNPARERQIRAFLSKSKRAFVTVHKLALPYREKVLTYLILPRRHNHGVSPILLEIFRTLVLVICADLSSHT